MCWSESFILLRVRVLSILYWGRCPNSLVFVYDSKVVDNDRTVKLGAGQRTIRQVVYEIIGRQDISLHIVENHILINQLQVQCPVVTTSKDTLAYFTLEGKLQDNQSGGSHCLRHGGG